MVKGMVGLRLCIHVLIILMFYRNKIMMTGTFPAGAARTCLSIWPRYVPYEPALCAFKVENIALLPFTSSQMRLIVIRVG